MSRWNWLQAQRSTYANEGCHVDTEGGGSEWALRGTALIWIAIFVTLGLSIAGSVMGCCKDDSSYM